MAGITPQEVRKLTPKSRLALHIFIGGKKARPQIKRSGSKRAGGGEGANTPIDYHFLASRGILERQRGENDTRKAAVRHSLETRT